MKKFPGILAAISIGGLLAFVQPSLAAAQPATAPAKPSLGRTLSTLTGTLSGLTRAKPRPAPAERSEPLPTASQLTPSEATPSPAAVQPKPSPTQSSTAPAQPVSSGYREYVALGDSWTADVVTGLPTSEFVPFGCAQSPTDYPHQVAALLGVPTFRDASCGDATSDNFAQPQPRLPVGGTNTPQFDRLSPTTDLVTVGIGGNDIGLAGAVVGCLNLLPVDLLGLPAPLGRPCTKGFTADGVDRFQEAIKAAEPKIRAAVRQIHQLSPKADVFMVNYFNALPVSGKGCWPIVPITDGDMSYLQRTFLSMNAMIARVARDTNSELIDTYSQTIGHDLCQPPGRRYVEGIIPISLSNPLLLAFPAHPNQLGADIQARIVASAIRQSRSPKA